MGLDLALAVVVLLFAIRGLFQGALIPVLKLAGMVGCVYLAAPIRDASVDSLQPYFSAINPATFSKMLWWASAFLSYVSLVGIASLFINLADRKLPTDFPGRSLSRGMGLFLGAAKGALVSALILTGILHYESKLQLVVDLKPQMDDSQAMTLVKDHQPIQTIWNWSPVVALRNHIHEKGWFDGFGAKTANPDEALVNAAKDEIIKQPKNEIPGEAAAQRITPQPKPDRDILKEIDDKFGGDSTLDAALRSDPPKHAVE